MISVKDISWAAGLLEGEGSFMLRRGKDLVVQLIMTDQDVVDRFQFIFNFGSRSERILLSGKTAYGWSVTNQSQAAGLMMTLLPFMGERRAAKICECLAAWKTKPLPKRLWTHCKNGHELSGNNLRTITEGKYQKRRCKECGKLRQQKHREGLAA